MACFINVCNQFLWMVFAITPGSEQCRNIFLGIPIDCQEIEKINGVQAYFTLTVGMMILVCARRD